MYLYLAGREDNLLTMPVPLVADLLLLKRQSGTDNLVPALRRSTWYRYTMLVVQVLLHFYYSIILSNRSEKFLNSSKPRADIDTLRNLANSLLPPLAAILEDHPLPPYFFAPEVLLLMYFPDFFDSLPAHERLPTIVRFHRALRVETSVILVTAFRAVKSIIVVSTRRG